MCVCLSLSLSHTYIHTYVCIYKHMICVYVCMYTHTLVHTHTHTHMYTHTHKRARAHTHTHLKRLGPQGPSPSERAWEIFFLEISQCPSIFTIVKCQITTNGTSKKKLYRPWSRSSRSSEHTTSEHKWD